MLLPGFLRIAVGSLLVHGDPFRSGNDHDRQLLASGCVVQRGAQTILRTHQVDPDGKLTAGLDCALDLGIRSLVRAHGVERNIRERGHGAG